jgi:hypothetical protein
MKNCAIVQLLVPWQTPTMEGFIGLQKPGSILWLLWLEIQVR